VQEVANMVVYVCSPQASATTGAALHVDGTSCGFAPPTRAHAPDNLLPEPLPSARKAA